MELLAIALLGIAAYLIGSIPPAYLLTHYRKAVDIREVGSRNAGTLNTYHNLGPWWALLVFIIDAGKGALAVLLPAWVGVADWAVFITGPLVVAGHNWTVLLKFRGGKGAATLIGVCLAIAPAATMLAAIPGIASLFLSKNGIVGLTVGFVLVNLLAMAAWVFNLAWLVTGSGWQPAALCMLLTLMVVVTYGFSIRNQLLEAFRERNLRKVFYGP